MQNQLPLLPEREPAYELKIAKKIRIAVSGDVRLTALEIKIIDTADFQRLRGIRQLGSVHLTYPSALHTRFDHSLGTLAMAENMVKAIKDNAHSTPAERRIDSVQHQIVRLYALLHDITHVPFGHTIEDELGIFQRHDKNSGRIDRLLGEGSDIGRLIANDLEPDNYKRFIAIFTWDGSSPCSNLRPEDSFIYDLVSNTVCADLLDYIKRDDYFCNLSISFEYRFLDYLYLGWVDTENPQDDVKSRLRVMVRLWKGQHAEPRPDILMDLARLLQARYLLAERVYFHKSKIILGTMLARAIQEAHLDGWLDESALLLHTDDTLVHTLAAQENSPLAKRLASLYKDRKLYKILHNYTRHEVTAHQLHDHSYNQYHDVTGKLKNSSERRSLEDEIAVGVGADPGEVLIYAPGSDMNSKVAGMRVLWEGKPEILGNVDNSVIRPFLDSTIDAHKSLWGIYVLCAPTLSRQQKLAVRQWCDLEFATPMAEYETKARQLYGMLVEFQIKILNSGNSIEPAIMLSKREEAVDSLMALNKDGRSLSSRLRVVVKKVFE